MFRTRGFRLHEFGERGSLMTTLGRLDFFRFYLTRPNFHLICGKGDTNWDVKR